MDKKSIVYLCKGCGIGEALDFEKLAEAAGDAGISDTKEHEALCSPAGLDMIKADVLFAATGVTNGSLVRGARRVGEYLETETLLMRSRTGSVRRLIYRTKNF